MPRIPTLESTQNPFPDNPPSMDISPESFGKDAAAMARLGGVVGDIGGKLMEVRKRAMESDAINTHTTDFIQWKDRTEKELKMKYSAKDPDGNAIVDQEGNIEYDPTGFADEYKKQMDTKLQDTLSKMPTGDSQLAINNSLQGVINSEYGKGIVFENEERVKKYERNFLNTTAAYSKYLINDPSIGNYVMVTDLTREAINRDAGNLYPKANAGVLYRKYTQEATYNLFHGFELSKQNAEIGLDILNSISEHAPLDPKTGKAIVREGTSYPDREVIDKDGNKVIVPGGLRTGKFGIDVPQSAVQLVQTSMTAEQIRDWRRRLEAAVKRQSESRMTGAAVRESSFWSAVNNTEKITPDIIQNGQYLMGFYKDQWGSDPDKKELLTQKLVKIEMALNYAEVREQMLGMHPNKKVEFDNELRNVLSTNLKSVGFNENDIGAELNQFLKNNNNDYWKHILAERKKDPSAYVEKYFGQEGVGGFNGPIPSNERINWRQTKANSLGMGFSPLTGSEVAALSKEINSFKSIDPNRPKNASPERAANILDSIKRSRYGNEIMSQLYRGNKVDDNAVLAYYRSDKNAAAKIMDLGQKGRGEEILGTLSLEDKKELNDKVKKAINEKYSAFAIMSSDSSSARLVDSLREKVLLQAAQNRNTGFGKLSQDAAISDAFNEIIDSEFLVADTAVVPREINGIPANKDRIERQLQFIKTEEYQKKVGLYEKRSIIRDGRWRTKADFSGAQFVVRIGGKWIPLANKGKAIEVDFAELNSNPKE